VPLARTAAALAVAGILAGCASEPDRLPAVREPVPVDEPKTLTLEYGGSSMWADAATASRVRCDAWPSGEPSARAELRPHYTDTRNPIPVERDGVDYYSLGRFPQSSGEVVVQCTGPGQADLYASLTRPPAR
jgi:hypothetical protein